jgi:hypothetical protein
LSFSPVLNSKHRIIWTIVANGQIVRSFADKGAADKAYNLMMQMKGPKDLIAAPQATELVDNQTIDSKGWDKVRTGWN